MRRAGQWRAAVSPWLAGLLLFAGALAIRLLYLRQLARTAFADERELIADAAYYDMRGAQIASGDWMGEAAAYLSPLLCYELGGAYALFGHNPAAAKIVHAVLGALSCVLVYRIGALAFSEGVGLAAGVVFALYGVHIYYTGLLLPAVLVLFVNLLFLWVMIGASEQSTPPRHLGAGVLLGLATLAKSNAILLLPIAVAWPWVRFRAARSRRKLAWSLALVLGAGIALAPTTLRNHVMSGEFVLVTTTSGRNLLKGNGPNATGSHVSLPTGERGANLKTYLEHTVDPKQAARENRELTEQALAYMLENPGHTLRLFLRKLLLFFNARELGIRDDYYFAQTQTPLLRWPFFGFGLVGSVGLVGCCFAWRRRAQSGLLYAMLGVQVASFVLVFVLSRYRLVAAACLTIFAAWQGLHWGEQLGGRRWRLIAPSLPALAAALGLVLLPLPGLSRERGRADQLEFVANHNRRVGDWQEALEGYQSALRARWVDEDRSKRHRWRVMRRLAETQLHLRRFDEAERTLSALSAEIDSNDPEGAAGYRTLIADLRRLIEKYR